MKKYGEYIYWKRWKGGELDSRGGGGGFVGREECERFVLMEWFIVPFVACDFFFFFFFPHAPGFCMPLALLVLYAIYILMIRLCFLMFSVESDGVASSEASASRIDILDGVRNFRPRQVKILKHSLLRFGEGGENGGGGEGMSGAKVYCV